MESQHVYENVSSKLGTHTQHHILMHERQHGDKHPPHTLRTTPSDCASTPMQTIPRRHKLAMWVWIYARMKPCTSGNGIHPQALTCKVVGGGPIVTLCTE